jgi:hypothetical protein
MVGLEEMNMTMVGMVCAISAFGIYRGNRAGHLREKAHNIINGSYARFLASASERGSRFLHRFYCLGEPSQFIRDHAEIRD